MLFYLLREKLTVGEIFLQIIMMFIAITLTFAFHEFMHAATAVWLGDNTPKSMGRLTLNPLAHVDPTGAILILLIGFGWGRPVICNPAAYKRFKNRRLMDIMVSFAGPFGNFIMAFIATVVCTIIYCVAGEDFNPVVYVFYNIFSYLQIFSLGLMAFNLLPIYPLDGFKILDNLIPLKIKYNSEVYRKFAAYGPRILLVLILLGRLGGMDILGTFMTVLEIPAAFVLALVQAIIEAIFGV